MTTVGLLTLVLCAAPGDTPSGEPGRSPIEVLLRDAIQSPYHPVTSSRRAVDVVGRVNLIERADLPGRALVAGPISIGPALTSQVGLVYEPAYSKEPDLCVEPASYVPQAGDIVLVVSDHLIWQVLFTIALSCEPYHVGIVVRMPDGTYGMLEAGPPDVTSHVRISPLAERLTSDPGRVFIRRRCIPLTAGQSDALTGFALRQEGKPYAYIRFLAQGTPLRSRGPIRTHFMGMSRGEPYSYFCSELVMESLVSAGLVDAETARPRATTPADIFFDESTNPWINKYLKLYPSWCPPQRWVAERCDSVR
jgi:hypothetical protein